MSVRLPIERLEAIPVRIPMATSFDISGGGKEYVDHVLVRLHTENGVIGLGEAAPKPFFAGETQDSVLGALDRLESALNGVDAGKPVEVHRVMENTLKGNHFAKAAVDIACHDALGKALDVPVSTLLGGRVTDRIQVGQSIGIKDTESAVADARRYVHDAGFASIKVKVGSDTPERDEERVRAICDAVGDTASIRVDANQGYTADIAVPLFSRLERDRDLLLVEQPVGGDDIAGMRRVTQALETPVLADESVFGPSDAATIVRREAADIVNIKLMKSRGLYPGSRIAATAQAGGLPLAVGSMVELGVGTAAGAHFAAAHPGVQYPCDVKGPSLLETDVLRSGIRIEDGHTYVPDGPGLGVEIDDSTVDQYRVD